MKLVDVIHHTKKTIALTACVVFVLTIILRIFTFRQDCQKLANELAQQNQAEHHRDLAPSLSIAARRGNSDWSDSLVLRPGGKFQVQVTFQNNLNVTCTSTQLNGRTRSKFIAMSPTSHYRDTEGNEYDCILGIDDNAVQLPTGDQPAGNNFTFEQAYTSKPALFGKPHAIDIQYTVSNSHFVTTATYYVGIVPLFSWREILEFLAITAYLALAITWEYRDSQAKS